jgi:hypothetical protein
MAVLYGKPVRDSQSGMWLFEGVYPSSSAQRRHGVLEEIKIEAIRTPTCTSANTRSIIDRAWAR